ncbi:MAG: L-ribulose-5-phosphate 4-epimerase [Spirochaetes bacterium]|nr:L-ribulose-5-phosphate 4-epimerase [Spirochaetota bacterium]
MLRYKELKEITWRCNMELWHQRLIIYTFGNASTIDRDQGVFAIKPSGVPYEKLKAKDMVIVDLDNRTVEGKLRYSSDTKTHSVLYKNFSQIGGVVHTHSPYSVAWAQAKRSIPVLGTTHADHLTHEVPCTEVMSNEMIKGDYEEETGNQIIETFKKQKLTYKEIEMVLVACHGPFTWGSTPEKAVYNSIVLEELAKMALYTFLINPEIKEIKKELIDKHYFRKHGKNSYYGQNT